MRLLGAGRPALPSALAGTMLNRAAPAPAFTPDFRRSRRLIAVRWDIAALLSKRSPSTRAGRECAHIVYRSISPACAILPSGILNPRSHTKEHEERARS